MADRKENVQIGDYITSAEAGKILALTQRRIAQLCANGGLEGVKVARRWFVKRDSVYGYQKGR